MLLFIPYLGCSNSLQDKKSVDHDIPISNINQIELTWYGVTTIRMQFGDTTWLLDPFFSRPQGGTLESNEIGIQHMKEYVGSSVDRIFVGHSHYDHTLDAKSASALYNAPIYGSQTTCFLMGDQDCQIVHQGWQENLDGVEVTALRTPHWRPDWETIGSFSELSEHSEDMVSAPNGGVITYVFEFPNQQSIVFQDSMGSLDIPDGSSENYRQNLDFFEDEEISLWLTCGDCLENKEELATYFSIIQPKRVLPIHWDGLMPNLEMQPMWNPPQIWTENVEEFGVQELTLTGYGSTIAIP